MTGLAPVDALAVLAILFKAAGYGAALLSMGGVLFVAAFRGEDPAVLGLARRIAVAAALAGLAVLAVRFGLRAARISGMGWAGATDPTMLGFVWQSPLGAAAPWRGVGEALILAVMLPGAGLWVALAGAVAVAVSYAQVGHTLGDPRVVLGGLLVVHLLVAAFWVGALAPLARAAGTGGGVAMLRRFGVLASGTVAVLIAAGVALAWLLSGSLGALVGTAYGWTLLAKVTLVGGLLGLAAYHRWRLVPDLAAGRSGGAALRRSIAVEAVVVAVLLVVTATLTTVTTPPMHL